MNKLRNFIYTTAPFVWFANCILYTLNNELVSACMALILTIYSIESWSDINS